MQYGTVRPPLTYAAGVLCWRQTKMGVSVLVVRRAYYDDVSIPKGKVDPGELLPQTAARELLEETKVKAVLGAPIGETRYTVKTGPKVVKYWLAEVTETAAAAAAKAFKANSEIASAEWLPIDEARAAVTYPHDAQMIDDFAARLADGTARTFPIIITRHGKATAASEWRGPDSERPLDPHGQRQAQQIAPAIAAFGPQKIVSSSALRCLETVAPLAKLAKLTVKSSNGISQDAYEDGAGKPAKQILKRLEDHIGVVLCSHGPVIPQLVGALLAGVSIPATDIAHRAANLATGEFAVFHLTDTDEPQLVSVEVHGAA